MQKKIENIRQQLYNLISQDASFDKIYKKSTELDLLIVEYYSIDARVS